MVLFLKILALPLYPLGLSIVILSVGLVLTCMKKVWGRYVITAGIIVLYLFSTPLVSRIVLKLFENRYVVQNELPQGCAAIVVLGGSGMSLAPPMVYPEINSAGDRLLHAARLFKMGVAPRIITSGGFPVGSRLKMLSEGEQNAMILREIGVDSSAIIIENRARTTAEHPPLIAHIMDSLGLRKKVVLVTSATHMARSAGVFRKAGYEVFPAATDFRGNGRLVERLSDVFPSSGALDGFTSAVHELYGIIGYRVLGKM